jgi:hypothetical protein
MGVSVPFAQNRPKGVSVLSARNRPARAFQCCWHKWTLDLNKKSCCTMCLTKISSNKTTDLESRRKCRFQSKSCRNTHKTCDGHHNAPRIRVGSSFWCLIPVNQSSNQPSSHLTHMRALTLYAGVTRCLSSLPRICTCFSARFMRAETRA